MSITEILLIASGVSIDAAAVSISGSLCPGKYSKRRCAFNAACFFGGFQFFMPLIGYFTAGFLTRKTAAINPVIAFILLLFVGGKMIWEACHPEDNESCPLGEFFSPANLFIPAVATSLDALAIGAGLAFSGTGIWLPSAAMGIVTALVAATCVLLGKKISSGKRNGKTITICAGCVIILIGAKILGQAYGLLPQF